MKKLKTALWITVAFLTALPALAQRQRVSPHETVSGMIGGRNGCRVTVVYGRPYTKDPRSAEMRKIWGGLVPYDKAWRMGADEATVLITQQPLVFGETTIPAGAYTLYMLPSESGASKLAFSSRLGGWGIPVDETHDVGRIELKKDTLEKPADQFTIAIESGSSGDGVLKLMWEGTQYSASFKVKK